MQDRYAGDLGDLLKLGLLRWLAGEGLDELRLPLGVVWYLTADESHNADGKHVAYLNPDHRSASQLRSLDPSLYDGLKALVASGHRSVEQLERCGVLPADTCTFRERLSFEGLDSRPEKIAVRQRWLSAALAATEGCDLVFLDPDNGIRSTEHRSPSHRRRAEKHAYLDEVAAFADREQSVVVYHHADRSEPVAQQARRWGAELRPIWFREDLNAEG